MPERRLIALAAIVLLASATSALAASAPAQLRGKSVTLFWSESGTYKRVSDGKQFSPVGRQSRIVYVSETGRVFRRSSVVSGTAGKEGDKGPEEQAGQVGFGANAMTITTGNLGTARRVSVTFDAAFSSCSASVSVGKLGPGSTIRGYDGAVYEVLSMSPGAVTCSVRAGNALAN